MLGLLSLVAYAILRHDADERTHPTLITTYRTRDGRADYQFSVERQSDGSYRAFILSQPNYGGRSTGAHETHRLSANGRRYVCWNRPLYTAERAKIVAALWADATQAYIATGQRF